MNMLLVDDQKQVIQGILTGIDWSQIPEIQNIFYAYTAQEARHIFTNQTIDILISDIEMPEEDGLSLVNWVREHFPETKCLFLTAHANFDYAQNAIRLDCVDYILQPVSYEALKTTVIKTAASIMSARQGNALMNYNTFWNQHRETLQQQVWLSWLSNKFTTTLDSFLDQLTELNVPTPSGPEYFLLFFVPVSAGISLDDLIDFQATGLNTLFTDFFSQFTSYMCPLESEPQSMLQLFCCNLGETEIYSITQTFIDLCCNNHNLTLAAYLTPPTTIKALPDVLFKLRALKSSHLAVSSKIFTLSDITPESPTFLPATGSWNGYFSKGTTNIIVDALKKYIEKNIHMGSLNSITLLTLQQYLIHEFLTSLRERSIRFKTVIERPDLLEALTFSTRSVKDFFHFVEKIMDVNRILCTTTVSESSSDTLIETAEKYIAEHISDHLSRQIIAENIHVSESYLSHLFQKHHGISLVEFITRQRMELASSMLTDTVMPIHLIALKTGYNNVSYFIKTFKRTYHVTPALFRENGSGSQTSKKMSPESKQSS